LSNSYVNYYKEWIELYKSGKTITYISEQYKCGNPTVYRYLYKVKCLRSRMENSIIHHNAKYGNSESYFDSIDSEEKAYFLGLIVTDGYIGHRNTKQQHLGLRLTESDGYMVDKLAKVLGRKMRYRKEQVRVDCTIKPSYELYVVSDHIVNTLRRFRY
jgi:hypothetical protein